MASRNGLRFFNGSVYIFSALLTHSWALELPAYGLHDFVQHLQECCICICDFLIIPPTWSLLCWRAALERLITTDIIAKILPNIDDMWQLCGDAPESAKHLFFQYQFSKVLWDSK